MRISRHNMFMEVARIFAQRGTCPRLCVGAVIVQGGKDIVAHGYNGAASGQPHCTDVGCIIDPNNGISCIRAKHAEINAIYKAMDEAPSIDAKLSIYVTHSPCVECAKAIIAYGIREVYFETPYRSLTGLVKLSDAHVRVFRVLPNGYLVEGVEGKLIEAR